MYEKSIRNNLILSFPTNKNKVKIRIQVTHNPNSYVFIQFPDCLFT
jgi:hypothetical protein